MLQSHGGIHSLEMDALKHVYHCRKYRLKGKIARIRLSVDLLKSQWQGGQMDVTADKDTCTVESEQV
jgi:hypothetical protein